MTTGDHYRPIGALGSLYTFKFHARQRSAFSHGRDYQPGGHAPAAWPIEQLNHTRSGCCKECVSRIDEVMATSVGCSRNIRRCVNGPDIRLRPFSPSQSFDESIATREASLY